MRRLIFLYLIFSSYSTIGQEWIRVYGQEHYVSSPYNIGETYDKGYLVCSNFYHTNSSSEQISILKTDINGYEIFEKKIGNQTLNSVHSGGFCFAPDGGILISGQIFSEDSNGDPFILKLDPCYNLQWCNIYHTPSLYDWAGGICYLPWDSTYVFEVFNHYYDMAHKRISLFKIDLTGNLIWNNLYCTNPDYWNETLVDNTISTTDSAILIYGFVMIYNTQGLTRYQPYWSKISNNGEMLWERISIPDTTFISGVAQRQPFFTTSGNILCPTQAYSGDGNRLSEFSSTGTYLGNVYLNQPDSVEYMFINNSEKLSGKFVYGFRKVSTDITYHTLMVTDTLNILINETTLPEETTVIYDIQKTFDNKILVSSAYDAEGFDFMLLKYNENLQFDSVYNNPIIYDSLCPGEITSGTIELACNITTDLKDQAINQVPRIKAAPNPADSYTVLYLPEVISVKRNGRSNTESFRSDYVKDLKMTIFDSSSKLKFEDEWPDNTKELVLNTSGWKSGMYFIRVLKNNDLILTGKLIVD